MIVADWVFLGIILGGLSLGALLGFGRVFKFFTTGIFGIIISIVVCFLIGAAFQGAAEPLLNKLANAITANENWFCQFLCKINIQVVLYYVIMFAVVWVLRYIIVKIIKAVSESENKIIKVLNRLFGALLFLGMLLLVGFLIIRLIGWVGGDTAENFYNYLNSGLLGLGRLFAMLNADWYANYTAPPADPEGFAFLLKVLA